MEGHPPWSNPEESKRGPGDLYGIVFQNIRIAAHGVVEDEPELLWGTVHGLIFGLVFDNVIVLAVTEWKTLIISTTINLSFIKLYISKIK